MLDNDTIATLRRECERWDARVVRLCPPPLPLYCRCPWLGMTIHVEAQCGQAKTQGGANEEQHLRAPWDSN